MATVVWTNAKIVINSVDLSDHVKQVSLTYEADMLDETAMGTLTHKMKPGLLNWSLEIEFFSDFAAAKVDATLYPLVGAAAFPVTVAPVNTTISATNPEYRGNAVVATYPLISGSVGDMATSKITFKPSGTLTRAVTP